MLLTLLGYRVLLTLLGRWVLGAADAARSWNAAVTLLGCWVLGTARGLLGCCEAGVLHEAVGYWFVC